MPPRACRLRAPLVLGGGALVAAVALALRDPHVPGSYGWCPIYALTGWFCPGCGALRAVHDLLHLNLSGAMAMNPLMVLAVPVVVALWVRWLWRAWRGRPVTTMSVGGAVLLGVGLLAFAVARNIPALMPWLAP
jgi:Protein of unknown function (DUF2752)